MIKADCHMHTAFSSDSQTPPEKMVERAIELGLERICFTDHFDYLFPHDVPGGFVFDTDEYFDYMQKLRDNYSGKIEIGIGVELGLRYEEGFFEKTLPFYRDMVSKYDFDFVIGSTHLLDNYDPYYPEYWEGKENSSVIRYYFETIVSNIKNYDTFDSYGHTDYIVRYAPTGPKDYSFSDYSDVYDRILRGLIEKGKALEVNSAGLAYGLGFAHPKREVLERYRELGGELITVGSDAHVTERLAYGFDEVCEVLKDVGFRYYTVYKNRKPVQQRLS